MGILDSFGKKDDRQPLPPPPSLDGPPTDKVLSMRRQGLSNNQIIQSLQREGYDPKNIFDGLNQADIKGTIQQMPTPTGGPIQSSQDFSNPMNFQDMPPMQMPPPQSQQRQMPPQQPGGYPPMDQSQSAVSQMPPPMSFGPGQGQTQEEASLERIEELAEAIIDEKWNEIVKSINKIIDWKDRTESKISKIEQEFADLKESFENLQKGVFGKVSEYDHNITDLGSDIKAMEKVFQKVLPSLTESIHTLERVSKDIRAQKPEQGKEQ